MASQSAHRRRPRPADFNLDNFGVRNIELALSYPNTEPAEMTAEVRRAAKRMGLVTKQIERLQMEQFFIARQLLLGATGDRFWREQKHLNLMHPGLRRAQIRWVLAALKHAARLCRA